MSTGNKERHKNSLNKEQKRRIECCLKINKMRHPSFADTDSPSNVGNECGVNIICKHTNQKTLGING